MKVHEATRRRNSVTGDEYSNRSNLGTKEVLSQSLYFHPLSVALSTKEAVSVSISTRSVWILARKTEAVSVSLFPSAQCGS